MEPGSGGVDVAVRAPMPVSGSGTFFFAAHRPSDRLLAELADDATGSVYADWVGRLLEGAGSLVEAGFRDLVILSCQSPLRRRKTRGCWKAD